MILNKGQQQSVALLRRVLKRHYAAEEEKLSNRRTVEPPETIAKKKNSLRAITSAGTLQTAVEVATRFKEDDAQNFATVLDANPGRAVDLFQQCTGLSPKEARIVLCNYSYAQFAYTYLPHHFTIALSERYHGEYFKLLAAVERHYTDKPTVVSAPRETGKSTMGNLLLPLHAIHYPTFTLLPNGMQQNMSKRFIVYMSSTQKNAMAPLYDLSTELEFNDSLHADFGNLYLDPNGARPLDRPWSKTAIITGNGVRVESVGRYAKIRGMKFRQYRPDLFIPDDLEDDKSVQSAVRRQDDVKWVNEALIPSVSSTNGNILFLGTLLHPGSMLAKLVDFGQQNKWNVRVFPIYEDTPEGRVYLWPQRYGPEWVQKKLEEIPESAFTQEYLQKPGSTNKDIAPDAFVFYDKSFPEVLDAIESGRYIVCIGVDPAAKTGERNDYTAIVPVALDPTTGIKYVLPAMIERLAFGAKVQAVINTHIKWNAVVSGIESQQFQVALKEAIDLETRRQGVTIHTMPILQSYDKKLRISRLYSAIAAGTIRFLRHRTHSVIIDQLLNLYTCDHDDGADALEISIRCHDDRRRKQSCGRSNAVAEF